MLLDPEFVKREDLENFENFLLSTGQNGRITAGKCIHSAAGDGSVRRLQARFFADVAAEVTAACGEASGPVRKVADFGEWFERTGLRGARAADLAPSARCCSHSLFPFSVRKSVEDVLRSGIGRLALAFAPTDDVRLLFVRSVYGLSAVSAAEVARLGPVLGRLAVSIVDGIKAAVPDFEKVRKTPRGERARHDDELDEDDEDEDECGDEGDDGAPADDAPVGAPPSADGEIWTPAGVGFAKVLAKMPAAALCVQARVVLASLPVDRRSSGIKKKFTAREIPMTLRGLRNIVEMAGVRPQAVRDAGLLQSVAERRAFVDIFRHPPFRVLGEMVGGFFLDFAERLHASC